MLANVRPANSHTRIYWLIQAKIRPFAVGKSVCCWWMSALANICLGKCLPWQMSALANVCLGKCLPWHMSALANVCLGKCLPWQMSALANDTDTQVNASQCLCKVSLSSQSFILRVKIKLIMLNVVVTSAKAVYVIQL